MGNALDDVVDMQDCWYTLGSGDEIWYYVKVSM